MMKRTAKWKRYLVAYTFFLELLHLVLPLNWGDDRIFFEKAKDYDLFAFLQSSSRILVDATTFLFAKYPLMWRILNPLVLLGLSVLLIKLLGIDNYKHKISISLLVTVLSMSLVDAGFMATTVNYLWPVTFALFVIYCALTFDASNRFRWLQLILSVPFLLYAMNMQQLSVVLVPVLILLLVKSMKEKGLMNRIIIAFYLLLTVLASAYLFYKSAFGESSRMIREASRYFPNYNTLTVFERLELGFSSTFHGLFMALHIPSVFVLLLCVFLLISTIKRSPSILTKILSLCTVMLSLVLLFLGTKGALDFLDPPMNYKMNDALYHFSWKSDFAFLLFIVIFVAVLLNMTRKRESKCIVCFVLTLGLASRMLMGFSPTVWASGYRTFYILLISMVVVGYYVAFDGASIQNRSEN